MRSSAAIRTRRHGSWMHHLEHIATTLALVADDEAPIDLKTVLAQVAQRRRTVAPDPE